MTDRFSENCRLLAEKSPEQLSRVLDAESEPLVPAGTVFPHGSTQGFPDIVDQKHLYVLYGLGDAEYALRILEHDAVHELLVYEPSVYHARDILKTEAMTQLLQDTRVGLVLGETGKFHIADIEAYFEKKAARYYDSGYFGNLVTPGTPKIPGYQEHYLKFAEAFRQAVQNYTLRIKANSTEDCFWGVINSLKNCVNYVAYPPLTGCRGIFDGVPGVVVGSGPSLELSLPFLKQIKDRAVVVSCDSTLKMLCSEGVEAHLVACLERIGISAQYFKDLPQDLKTLLVAPLVCNPQTFEKFPGKKFSIQRSVGFESWLLKQDHRYFLGSLVSHLAFVSLVVLGCREIYLVGLDSAYAPGDYNTYSGQAPEVLKDIGKQVRQDVSHYEFEVNGYDGQPRKTQYYWFEAANHFGKLISEHGAKVFNVMPKTHGIPIPGTIRVDGEDLSRLVEKPAVSVVARLEKMHKPDFSGRDFLEREIKHGRDYLLWMVNACLSEALSLSRFMADFDRVYPAHRPYYHEKFREIEKKRLGIMLKSGGYFEKIMVPVILNEHALMEFELRRILSEEKRESQQLQLKANAYLGWFQMLVLWGQRIIHAIDHPT